MTAKINLRQYSFSSRKLQNFDTAYIKCFAVFLLGGTGIAECVTEITMNFLTLHRSGGGVVDNTLDYQSRGRKIDPPLLRSFG